MTEKEWQDEVNQLQYRSSNVIEIERERERERERDLYFEKVSVEQWLD